MDGVDLVLISNLVDGEVALAHRAVHLEDPLWHKQTRFALLTLHDSRLDLLLTLFEFFLIRDLFLLFLCEFLGRPVVEAAVDCLSAVVAADQVVFLTQVRELFLAVPAQDVSKTGIHALRGNCHATVGHLYYHGLQVLCVLIVVLKHLLAGNEAPITHLFILPVLPTLLLFFLVRRALHAF